ncbi:hypothetical protein CBM2637_B40059 [Cupriavidus taiwanensis]|nr:hypothetical protein CBM2637_B40059 [Cupriavidus taiwanensis]
MIWSRALLADRPLDCFETLSHFGGFGGQLSGMLCHFSAHKCTRSEAVVAELRSMGRADDTDGVSQIILGTTARIRRRQ